MATSKLVEPSRFCRAGDTISVLIWGHSFVRRLEHFCLENEALHNMSLTPETHLMFFKSRSGAKATHARSDFKVAVQVDADMVILDIGTNDLDSQRLPPAELAKEVFNIAKTLLDTCGDVKVVIILEVLFRSVTRSGPNSNPSFAADAHQYNNGIKALVNQQENRDDAPVRFWHHKGLVDQWPSYLSDGVHLNDEGMWKYQRSIKRAILKFSPIVRSKKQ